MLAQAPCRHNVSYDSESDGRLVACTDYCCWLPLNNRIENGIVKTLIVVSNECTEQTSLNDYIANNESTISFLNGKLV